MPKLGSKTSLVRFKYDRLFFRLFPNAVNRICIFMALNLANVKRDKGKPLWYIIREWLEYDVTEKNVKTGKNVIVSTSRRDSDRDFFHQLRLERQQKDS